MSSPEARIGRRRLLVIAAGALTVASLAAGGRITTRVSATIPLGAEAGSYVLTARVDDAELLPEQDDGNNVRVASAPIEIVRPDLEVTAVTAPTLGIVGQVVSVTTTVKNTGPAPSAAGPFSVDLFLVRENVDPAAPCSQEPCPRRVGGRTVARLGPGGVFTD